MFGIGIPELVLILIVGLIVFGPSKLPEVGRAVGKGLREFRKASSALSAAIDTETAPQPAPPTTPQPTATPQNLAATAATAATTTVESPPPPAPTYEPPTQESVKAQLAERQNAVGKDAETV